jgi:Transposase DDE domain group 1
LDERLGFGDLVAQHLTDSRRGKNTQLPLTDLFRQSVYSRIAGYEDVNDAERVSQDPTFRLIGSEKTWDRGAALTSRLQTFETEMLAEEDNFRSLAPINRELIAKAEATRRSGRHRGSPKMGRTRTPQDLHEPRRKAEPFDSHGNASYDATDERLQQEMAELEGCLCALVRLL